MTTPDLTARAAIGAILDGGQPNGIDAQALGDFAPVYREMVRAWERGGTEAARRVFVAWADRSPEVAALRAGDPEPERTVWSTAELLRAVFPDPKWAVEGILPTGLSILAGRPKLGKSWLSLQTAVAVGSGGRVFDREVDQGRALYLALEDSPRRLQERLRKQQAPPSAQVDFRFEWRHLTEGGTADLMLEIDQKGYSLIVIDTISRALGRADQMDQADMNVALGMLQRIALEREITLLLVDHHRKSAGQFADVIDDLMGATSKAGVADAVLGLYRERGRPEATLKVTGRDVDDLELAVKFDPVTGCWQLVGDAHGVRAESVQAEIVTAIDEMGGTATVMQVARWLGRDRSNVRREMSELVAKGKLQRLAKKGREVPYKLVEEDESPQ